MGDHAAGVRRDITWMQGFEEIEENVLTPKRKV